MIMNQDEKITYQSGWDKLTTVTACILLILHLTNSVHCTDSHSQSHKDAMIVTNITARLGETVSLKCQKNSIQSCVWEKNSVPLRIEGRYSYSAIHSGNHSTNCSIQIEGVLQDDEGSWKCSAKATDRSNPQVYSYIHLKVESRKKSHDVTNKDIMVNTSLTCNVGDKLLLPCGLKSEGNCVWKKNDIVVKIEDRYTYLSNQSGRNAMNCTIQINNVKREDHGTWQCSFSATSEHEAQDIAKIYLVVNSSTDTGLIMVSKQPKNTCAVLGTTIILECEFSDEVSCSWKRNHEVVQIEDRMKYIGKNKGNNTKNCSIEIVNVTNNDIATWICASAATDKHDPVSAKTIRVTVKTKTENKKPILRKGLYVSSTIAGLLLVVVIILAVKLKKAVIERRKITSDNRVSKKKKTKKWLLTKKNLPESTTSVEIPMKESNNEPVYANTVSVSKSSQFYFSSEDIQHKSKESDIVYAQVTFSRVSNNNGIQPSSYERTEYACITKTNNYNERRK